MKKIYSAVYAGFHPLDAFFPDFECVTVIDPEEIKEPGILILHGGGDISPSFYKQTPNTHNGGSRVPSQRDAIEAALANKCKELGYPVFGICRGAQLLCALSGGTLVQHVTNHSGSHNVQTHDDQLFTVNSIHHQMQLPEGSKHKVLAVVPERLSSVFVGEDNKSLNVTEEVEAVYYPEYNGLAFQWHPEMMGANSPANKWVRKQIKDFWNV